MEDDLDAFVDAACAPLLEEWGLSAPPPLHATGLQGSSSLALRDGAAVDSAAHASGDGAALARSGSGSEAAPVGPAAAEAWPGWRCLQPQHPANCIRCTPPPPVEQADSWMLVGDKTCKSGEKKLRSLISRVPEWKSVSLRVASVEQLQLTGNFMLATALRTRDSSTLRKAHLLTLCAHWRYKCDAWVPRCDAEPSKRRRTAPPSLPLPPPVPPPESSMLALRGVLRHGVALYASATDNSRVYAASEAEARAPMLTWSVPMFDSLLPWARAFAAMTAADATRLAERVGARGAGAPNADGPWWLSEDVTLLTRADAHLQLLRITVASNGAGLRSLTAAGAHALSAPDAAVAASWTASQGALAVLLDTCGSALATSRMQRNGAEYLSTAAEVMAALVLAVDHMIQVADERRAWCVSRDYARAPPATASAGGASAGGGGPAFWPAFLSTFARAIPTARCAGINVDRATEELHNLQTRST